MLIKPVTPFKAKEMFSSAGVKSVKDEGKYQIVDVNQMYSLFVSGLRASEKKSV